VFGEKDIDKGSYKEEFKVSINMLYILEGLTQRKPPGIKRYILLFCCSLILDRLSESSDSSELPLELTLSLPEFILP